MSTVVVVKCDGTPEDRPSIPLGQCRASYPTRQDNPNDAIAEALRHGWSISGPKELCPSCTGAKARLKR